MNLFKTKPMKKFKDLDLSTKIIIVFAIIVGIIYTATMAYGFYKLSTLE